MNSFRTLLLATLLAATPASSLAGVFVSITIAPPVLPVYVQPPCPADGYLWTPGYWAYAPAGYYWVPGTWVLAPRPGLLWTPGYWGFLGGVYAWHAGYWGPHVGFYGGVNYGFGYTGVGFFGGRWDGGHFLYNTSVTRVNTTVIHNVYNERVVNNVNTRASFNGAGGVVARPNAAEQAAAREQHVQASSMQAQHERSAAANHANFASENHGRPAMAAVSRPMASAAHGTAASPQARQAGAYHPSAASSNAHGAASPHSAAHASAPHQERAPSHPAAEHKEHH